MTDDYDLDDDQPKKQRNPRENDLHVIRNSMKTPAGRRMMWRFLSQASIFTSTFSPDSHAHAYAAGRRDYGLWLDRELRDADTDLYYLMLRENS